jgi:hypothetical protein
MTKFVMDLPSALESTPTPTTSSGAVDAFRYESGAAANFDYQLVCSGTDVLSSHSHSKMSSSHFCCADVDGSNPQVLVSAAGGANSGCKLDVDAKSSASPAMSLQV